MSAGRPAPREGLFAGLDVSTQSCKLVVIDPGAAEVVHVDSVAYDRDLPRYGTRDGVIRGLPEGVSESDPRMWIEAVDSVLERLAETRIPRERIRSISVSGQQHGLVALDREGRLARPTSKLWNDFSTAEECELLTAAVGGTAAMLAEVGNTQRPGYTASKILHLKRHEPDAWERASTLFVVKDYINWYLTGGARAMEPGDASGTALWNPATGAWSTRVMAAIDPGLAGRLPEVGPTDRSLGRVSPRLAERFGLDPACTIDAGSGDNMCAAIGTGNVRPGLVTVSLGTSGTACTVLDEPFIDPEGEIAAFRDATGRHLSLLCVSNLANGYNELLRLHDLTHEGFAELVAGTPPGNGGRLLVPWYAGERTPDLPQAAPVTFGFDLEDLSPARLCRAVLEGHVLNLHAGFRRMPVTADEIRLTGGLSRSPAWCRTIADVFETDAVPVEGEGAALGAALHAAWVWAAESGRPVPIDEVVEPFVRLDEVRRFRPRPEAREAVRRLRRLFEAVTGRLRGLPAPDPFEARAALRAVSPDSA